MSSAEVVIIQVCLREEKERKRRGGKIGAWAMYKYIINNIYAVTTAFYSSINADGTLPPGTVPFDIFSSVHGFLCILISTHSCASRCHQVLSLLFIAFICQFIYFDFMEIQKHKSYQQNTNCQSYSLDEH